jgi:hypothetical protein
MLCVYLAWDAYVYITKKTSFTTALLALLYIMCITRLRCHVYITKKREPKWRKWERCTMPWDKGAERETEREREGERGREEVRESARERASERARERDLRWCHGPYCGTPLGQRRRRRLRRTSAYVSIRQHTSAYVSIRQHTSAYGDELADHLFREAIALLLLYWLYYCFTSCTTAMRSWISSCVRYISSVFIVISSSSAQKLRSAFVLLYQ